MNRPVDFDLLAFLASWRENRFCRSPTISADEPKFLTLLVEGALAAVLPVGAMAGAVPHVLSAWAEGEGRARRYFAGRTDNDAPKLALPVRGHALVAHPHDRHCAYVCARRPGAYLIRFDPQAGTIHAMAEADALHRFEGHAIVDVLRGRVLTTESEL